jgi:cell division ATPase FtsA
VEKPFKSVPFVRVTNLTSNVSESIGPAVVQKCLDLARDCSVPQGYEIVHTLIRDFSVDGQPGVADPVGFSGEHLKMRVHVVIDESVVVQNVKNAVNYAGVSVDRMIVRGLAAGESSLNPDEKELGVPTRLGYPMDFLTETEVISDPSYCTALGLLRCASETRSTMGLEAPETKTSRWFQLIERIKRLLMDSGTGETVNFNRSGILPTASVSELPEPWNSSWSAFGEGEL